MNRQALLERVKIKLDEYTPTDEGVSHPIDKAIDPLLDEAARTLLKEMPIERLPLTPHVVTSFAESDIACQTLLLPDTVLRVASVKLTNWSRAVNKFYPVGSKEEAMQGNSATRGNVNRPVVIISRDHVNSAHVTRLACYGDPGGLPETTTVMVVNEQKPEELHRDLIEPLVYLAAALVCLSVERDKAAQALMAQYQKYLS